MRPKGKVIAVHTEHCFVSANGEILFKNIDEEFGDRLWSFMSRLKKENDIDFYANHIVFEMRTDYGKTYYIGINDNHFSLGIKMHSLNDSVRIPLENSMYFIHI